jgi:molybdate transport system substrate-binding protein
MSRYVIPLIAALVALTATASPAERPTVYSAASLRDVLPSIDSRPAYSFGGSGTLQTQIERGAPADVFVSASAREARALRRGGHCGRQVTFATNRLALIVPRSNPAGIRSVADLRGGGLRLAVGAPGVPVGDYTRELLARARLGSLLDRNTVSRETSVAGVMAKVALRAADAGFVYVTDARAADRRVRSIPLPAHAQPAIRYAMCAVDRRGARTRAARAFMRELVSERARRTLRRFGFGIPGRS